ncbi:MAG TPA: 50S ribosomal protein L19 [Flavobacteriales bacterium]|nr:50S ribosomal protein L19 [Flavobacteriales bacterium]HQW41890.1 50S ribosomal protein L19 [Flavobacteriales bacterium]
MDRIRQLEMEYAPMKALPAFKAGDTVTVHYKIVEGAKERIQQFQGVVIQRKGSGITATFTVRKISNNIGVERIFPVASPFIDKIDVNKRGDVNRARIFYLRGLRGKSARITEKRQVVAKKEPAVAK